MHPLKTKLLAKSPALPVSSQWAILNDARDWYNFNQKLNEAVAQGWIVHPESLQVTPGYGYNVLLEKKPAI